MPILASPLRPSYRQGYAHSAGESAYPELWQGLVGAWVPALGPTGGTLHDVSGRGNNGTLTNMDPATDWVVSGDPKVPGYALNFVDSTANVVLVANAPQYDFSGGITIAVYVDVSSSVTSFDYIVAQDDVTTNRNWFLRVDNPITQLSYSIYVSGARKNCEWTSFSPGSGFQAIVATYDRENMRLYVGGIERATLAETGAIDTDDVSVSIGNRGDAASGGEIVGNIAVVGLYNRAWTPKQVVEFTADPLAPFRLRRRRVWVGGAAGPITLTPDAVTVSLAVPQPTITLGAISMTPDPAAVSLAVPAPTISLAYDLTPDPTEVPLSVPAPTLTFGAISKTPDPVGIPLVVPDPTLAFGAISMTPDPAAIPISVPAPTISLGALAIAPDPAAIPISVPAPVIVLGALTLTPDPATIPINIPDPTLGFGAFISPDAVSVPLIVPDPVVQLVFDLAPSPVQVALQLPDGSITLGALTLSPDPVQVVLVAPAPTVSIGAAGIAAIYVPLFRPRRR